MSHLHHLRDRDTTRNWVCDIIPIKNKDTVVLIPAASSNEEYVAFSKLVQISTYVPRILLDHYLTQNMMSLEGKGTKNVKPLSFPIPNGCVVLADVSGFTKAKPKQPNIRYYHPSQSQP
ncbi:hypothetical protein AAMO2058_000744200 [Amorphochlora amoebiformis]